MRSRFDIAPPPRRRSAEPVVPMINVVFLLLIFFLLTARIVPSEPFAVTLPEAAGAPAGPDAPLYVSADGALAYGGLRGPDALRAAVIAGPVMLQADAALPATDLARLLADLSAAGADEVTLLTAGGS